MSRKTSMACSCSGRCCKARGGRCACRCHGANHRKASPRRAETRAPRPAKQAQPALTVTRFGAPRSITYVRHDGRHFVHQFGPSAEILVPRDGSAMLIIRGVRVTKFMEG